MHAAFSVQNSFFLDPLFHRSLKSPQWPNNQNFSFTTAFRTRFVLPHLVASSHPRRFICYASARPSLDDVERISRGLRAKKRGPGSRAVPHRLNEEERTAYENAKRKNVLETIGTGYRKERKGAPVVNLFRQWCDAMNQPMIHIMKSYGAVWTEEMVCVDFSTLREIPHENLVHLYVQNVDPDKVKIVKEGFSEIEAEICKQLFDSEPIWNIPYVRICLTFPTRQDAKNYAASVVETFSKYKITHGNSEN